MNPKNNRDPIEDTSYVDVPYNSNSYNISESKFYSADCPSSMIYDPASTYLNYNNESDMLNDIYPSMTVLPNTNIDNETPPNHQYVNGDDYTMDNVYYHRSGACSNSNSDNNIVGLQTPKLIQNNSINHIADNVCDDQSYDSYTQSRKRVANNNPLVYGLNSINGNDSKQVKTDKTNKGLRHFSMKVCEKVQQKKITTYNEVADELVHEFGENDKGPGNEQNIRRRVYDALNVLMAMNIISKDKKEIRWLGLPSNSAQEHQRLRNEGNEIFEAIKSKLKTIYELIIQQVSLQNLITHNKRMENEIGGKIDPEKCIQLPFLAISTAHNTDVVCRVNEKKDKYDITFSSDFELHDDSEILKRLGLTCNLDNPNCTVDDLTRSLALVPPNLSYYVKAMAGRTVTEFQEHVLNNRGYLENDNMMEFYNKINKTVFDSTEQQSTIDNQHTPNEIVTAHDDIIADETNPSHNHMLYQQDHPKNILNTDNIQCYTSLTNHNISSTEQITKMYPQPSSNVTNNNNNHNNVV